MGKILGVIPARYASNRFPGKMLAPLLGKSLIQRTYENALNANRLDDLVIATDDLRIFDHVRSFGGKVYMTPECANGTERAAHLVAHHFPNATVVVNIQGDEPCLNPTVIDSLITDLLTNDHAVMQTPVTPIRTPRDLLSPHVVKCVFDDKKRALYFSRSPIPYPQKELSGVHYRHIGVYCFKRDFILTFWKLPSTRLQKIEDIEALKTLEHGYPIHVTLLEHEEGIGVDTPDDLKKVEEILCRENTSLLQEASSLLSGRA